MHAMEINPSFLVVLVAIFAAAHQLVESRDQSGIISLDCGLTPEDYTYTDGKTNLTYISDADYTDTGESAGLKTFDRSLVEPKFWYLRRFPEGLRNCYNFNLKKGEKYLIGAGFAYENYDDKDDPPSFDLYLGPNLWASVETDSILTTTTEIIHVLTSDLLQVCLVKTGKTIPFISYLQLRPLLKDIYNNTQKGSLVRVRRDFRSDSYESEEDVLGRLWDPYYFSSWREINTSHKVDTSSRYELPQVVARSAATPENKSEPLRVSWSDTNYSNAYHVFLHFAEVELLKANESREFSIAINEEPLIERFSPPNFTVTTVSTTQAVRSDYGLFDVTLQRTEESTHPPLLNALEIYKVMELSELGTDQNDAGAIKNIKEKYELKKLDWQGDPCVPPEYLWDGLNCSSNSSTSEPLKVTSLNLSSSGLKGPIAASIANLTKLRALDLSNNNLTGEVPAFLATMESLSFIDLSANQLDDTIPQALLDRVKEGSLTLKLGAEPDESLCQDGACNPKSTKNILVPIVASVASLIILVAAAVLFFIFKRKNKKRTQAVQPIPVARNDTAFCLRMGEKERRFSYSEVQSMTNNFESVLGRGGFGMVYEGFLDGIKVAVKLLSGTSAQGYKEFKAEVKLLLTVHHKNLVSLVGYCEEGGILALIYEYMQNGDLKAHLSGTHGSKILSWASRLRIAVEAAQGLEYLHNGLKPTIIHRDIKTTNILLDERFQAKLADFGLSRSFPVDGESHVSTVVAGTPGYLAPECFTTNWFNEKSDVYSFGVVLLELITNGSVIDEERCHITARVKFILNSGDIATIVDSRLKGDFEKNSAWKAVELALLCADPSSAERPTMPHIVMQLKECLANELERMRMAQGVEYSSDHSPDVSLAFATDITPRPK